MPTLRKPESTGLPDAAGGWAPAPAAPFLPRRRGGAGLVWRGVKPAAAAIALLLWLAPAAAVSRFPPPDFESGYHFPQETWPGPRALWLDGLDVAVLLAGLLLTVYFALVRRSRRGLQGLGLAALFYFGFYRGGCVCSVGAIQNVLLALSDPNYRIALSVIAFFILPLLFALWSGRTFCAAVCPLGAIQDLVLFRPRKVPAAVDAALRVLPWAYLGAAGAAVLGRRDFLICRFDPFVAFFRRSGSLPMLAFGAGLLLACVFIGRAYCRYLCPYGVLLGLCSRAARRTVSICPDHCTNCGLCRDACPFGAIEPPTPMVPKPLAHAGRWSALAWGALAGAALLGFALGPLLAPPGMFPTLSAALAAPWARSAGYRAIGAAAALLPGFAVWARLRRLVRPPPVPEYYAKPAECVACGRCFSACPRERVRWNDAPGLSKTPNDPPSESTP